MARLKGSSSRARKPPLVSVIADKSWSMYLRNLRAGSILVGAAPAAATPAEPGGPEAVRGVARASRLSDGTDWTNSVCDIAFAGRF